MVLRTCTAGGGGGENETGELKVVRGPGMEFGLL